MAEIPTRDRITRVIVNARISTGDPRRPWADAAALAGDRVVAVGASAEIRKLAPRDAVVEDARGLELDARVLGSVRLTEAPPR
jgi:predicted amidohydrolase YtcJ